eukprot:CAMPEP_0119056112 /NCGR_PEP_ID=MMETSP1178-20130426/810_1 /TAXON_ID=33656 /ORGANISM="unid sp, Strain CCMP2000" /LENGTH=210 /DNA_ID=CAMNT_0007036807 /DNA_START=93 /DNA_END=725 /DNA_ORIENTATION=-
MTKPYYPTDQRTQNNMQRLLCLVGASTEQSKCSVNMIRPEIASIMGNFDLASLDPRVAIVYNGLVEQTKAAKGTKRTTYSTDFKDALVWLVWDEEGIGVLKAAADATNVSFSSSGRSKEKALQAEVNRLTHALQKKDEEFEAKVEAEVQLRLAEMLPGYDGAQSDTTEQTDVADLAEAGDTDSTEENDMADLVMTEDEILNSLEAAYGPK